MTKRYSMFIPVLFVAAFGALASCGEKEAKMTDDMEKAADEAGDAAKDAADKVEKEVDK